MSTMEVDYLRSADHRRQRGPYPSDNQSAAKLARRRAVTRFLARLPGRLLRRRAKVLPRRSTPQPIRVETRIPNSAPDALAATAAAKTHRAMYRFRSGFIC
jgi:hypothetical protein